MPFGSCPHKLPEQSHAYIGYDWLGSIGGPIREPWVSTNCRYTFNITLIRRTTNAQSIMFGLDAPWGRNLRAQCQKVPAEDIRMDTIFKLAGTKQNSMS